MIDLPQLIAGLSDPDAYPHTVGSIRVAQTHASCVFLTGQYAYKIKKSVNFGFLDYSTLENRRRLCERELVLNRRLCPEVYLDVVPIVWQALGLRVAVPGEALEWAVRMRQLPRGDMLPARLAAGAVSAMQIEQIADVLAAFHSAAAAGPEIATFGEPEAISRNVEENFSQTENRTGQALPAEHLAFIRAYSHRFLTEHRDLFLARMRDGRVRDGHGDLRAQNICLAAGVGSGVQIFDCIEFNDRFRYGDVAADLAYLAMDLDLAGRADLRRILVDRYESSSGDDLSRLLPFYSCYRAYVRGKIALLAAEEMEIAPDQRRKHAEMAEAAFDLSRSYAERRKRPALFITVGLSGSGKSVLARELVRRLPAGYLASDAVRKERLVVATTARLPAERYGLEARRGVYQELFRRAAGSLARSEHVLLDATFLESEEHKAAAALAENAGAEFWVLECRCPDAVIRQRLRKRSQQDGDPSDAGLAVYEQQLQSYGAWSGPSNAIPLRDIPGIGHVQLQSDQAVTLQARRVLREFWKHAPAER